MLHFNKKSYLSYRAHPLILIARMPRGIGFDESLQAPECLSTQKYPSADGVSTMPFHTFFTITFITNWMN